MRARIWSMAAAAMLMSGVAMAQQRPPGGELPGEPVSIHDVPAGVQKQLVFSADGGEIEDIRTGPGKNGQQVYYGELITVDRREVNLTLDTKGRVLSRSERPRNSKGLPLPEQQQAPHKNPTP